MVLVDGLPASSAQSHSPPILPAPSCEEALGTFWPPWRSPESTAGMSPEAAEGTGREGDARASGILSPWAAAIVGRSPDLEAGTLAPAFALCWRPFARSPDKDAGILLVVCDLWSLPKEFRRALSFGWRASRVRWRSARLRLASRTDAARALAKSARSTRRARTAPRRRSS